ncbi:hypothetical protein [Numidum massiliense]|uniref:hypothetical protein n=1 Tax=Numidum massiliense TaxID=1522315 RepID=UPI00093E7B16|nr:hypothetical protein [Numidum massiliense]
MTSEFENICANCPGTHWGKKSICRVHDKHISQIETCPEWERQIKEDGDGQLSFLDIEPAVEVVEKVWEDLRSYNWMIKEVNRLNSELYKVSSPPEHLTAQYGIEAVMPKPKGTIPVSDIEMQRIERLKHRVDRLQIKVHKIERAIRKLDDDKERSFIDCVLSGWKMKDIARHIGVSRQRLNEIKRSVIKRFAWEMYEDELKGA